MKIAIYTGIIFGLLSLSVVAQDICPSEIEIVKSAPFKYSGIKGVNEAHNLQKGYVIVEFTMIKMETLLSQRLSKNWSLQLGAVKERDDYFNEVILRALKKWRFQPPVARCKHKERYTFEFEE